MSTRRVLAHYRQQPSEVLRYSIDYTPWLESGEVLTTVDITVDIATTPPLDIDQIFLVSGDRTVTFVVSGGVSGTQYQATVLAETDGGQTVEREVIFTVEEL
jgi:hypothetical protein